MNQRIKNIVCFSLVLVAILLVFSFSESFIAKALEDFDTVAVTQVVTAGIGLSCDESITLTPDFPSNPSGLTPASGPALDDFNCTVTTNNPNGFSLFIKNKDLGGNGFALLHTTNSNYRFTNYDTTPTYNWVDPTSGYALLGFAIGAASSSAAAGDVVSALKNNGSVCGSGTNVNDSSGMGSAKCWRGLNDTNNITIASSGNETVGGGETFCLRFQARANSVPLKAGYYATELTVTATY